MVDALISVSKHSENSEVRAVFICLSALLVNSAAARVQGSSSVFTSFMQFLNKQVQKRKSLHGNRHYLLNEELIFIDRPTPITFDLLHTFTHAQYKHTVSR